MNGCDLSLDTNFAPIIQASAWMAVMARDAGRRSGIEARSLEVALKLLLGKIISR